MAEEEETEQIEFDDQCFLMDYAHIIAPLNVGCSKEYDFCLLETEPDTGPYEMIATLRGAIGPDGNGLQEFLDITPAQAALLQPRVRLFKISYADEADPGTEVELKFNDFTSASKIESITASASGRGGGAGLKEFAWEFAGTNPAEAERVINVDLKMHFQTVLDLAGARDGATSLDNMEDIALAEPGNPSFMDLILLPPSRQKAAAPKANASGGSYTPQFYKIKAVVGWAIPSDSDTFSEEFKRELSSMNLIMYLNLITHEISIKEDGSVELSAQYVASMETAMDGKATDVLVSGPSLQLKMGLFGPQVSVEENAADGEIADAESEAAEIERNIADAEAAYACALQTGDEDMASEINGAMMDLKEDLEDLNEEIAEMKEDNREEIYETFIEDLTEVLMTIDMEGDFIEEWCESGASKEAPELDADITDAGGWFFDGDPEADDPKDPDKSRINFWFFGDIVQVAVQAMRNNPSAKGDMNVILGPLTYTSVRNGIQRQINLADVPVSSAMVMEWWKSEVVEKQRDQFPLKAFMTSLLNRIVVPALKPGCFPKADPVSADVSTVPITLPKIMGTPPITAGRSTLTDVMDMLTDMEMPEETDEPGCEYMLYYIAAYGSTALSGDPAEDRARGIYHYDIGRDSGLVKKISFNKADTPGLKEARQAEQGGLSQLREVYNAEVTMLGNNLYIPGMRIYVNPPYGLGNPSQTNSAANLLGLGGYFDVIKVKSAISRGGQYSTDLETIFAASGAPPMSDGECAAYIDTIKATDWYEETQGWLDGIIDKIDKAFDALFPAEVDIDC